VHLERGELEAAQTRLERALEANPRHVDVLYYLGLVTAQLAARTFERIVEQAPGSARAHQLLAESFEAQDRRPEAEREYEAAVAAQPDLVDALLGLAKLKRIRLDCEGANPLYTKAETIRPTFDGAFGLGTCAIRQGDVETALAHFERAVERDPRAAVAHVGLASSLLAVGRTADAIASLQRAIAIEPEMGEAYYMLGRAYQSAGDRARAQEAFAKAQRIGDGPPRDRARP
jgi:superkiller protein 3